MTITYWPIWWILITFVIFKLLSAHPSASSAHSHSGRIGGSSKAIAWASTISRTPIIQVLFTSLLSVRRTRSFLPPESPLRDTVALSIVENNAGHWNFLPDLPPFDKCILSMIFQSVILRLPSTISGLLGVSEIVIFRITCYDRRVWWFITFVHHLLYFTSNFVHYLSEDPALLLNHECFKCLEYLLVRAVLFHTRNINLGITPLTPAINDTV